MDSLSKLSRVSDLRSDRHKRCPLEEMLLCSAPTRRIAHAVRANLHACRQSALNLLRREPSRASIRRKRLGAAVNDDYRVQVVFGQ